MKLRQPNPKKKLRATAAHRVPQSRPMDEEEEEPTIRLSSAFVIVLLLHFVAIGGIWSFESIKVHQREGGDLLSVKRQAEMERQAAEATAPAVVTEPKVAPGEILTAATRTTTTTAAATPAPQSRKNAVHSTAHTSAHAHAPAAAVKDSGNVHVVASGENPVGIARKYGVSYDELLKLNKIDDPRRLQIGQKLQIPAKSK